MSEPTRMLDFPIPLSTGIAWLRLPWPLSPEEFDHVHKSVLAGIHFMEVAGWVVPEESEVPEIVATVEDES